MIECTYILFRSDAHLFIYKQEQAVHMIECTYFLFISEVHLFTYQQE